jgi:hypothetical protein
MDFIDSLILGYFKWWRWLRGGHWLKLNDGYSFWMRNRRELAPGLHDHMEKDGILIQEKYGKMKEGMKK